MLVVEFLPSEKQGMARVVCDELARQAYTSSTDVFVKRLIQLRELSEDWTQIDGIKNTQESTDTQESLGRDGECYSVYLSMLDFNGPFCSGCCCYCCPSDVV